MFALLLLNVWNAEGICYIFYWGREAIFTTCVFFVCFYWSNCLEKLDSFRAVWHLLILSTIRRSCVFYLHVWLLSVEVTVLKMRIPATGGAVSRHNTLCLDFLSVRHLFSSLFPWQGETEMPPHVTFKTQTRGSFANVVTTFRSATRSAGRVSRSAGQKPAKELLRTGPTANKNRAKKKPSSPVPELQICSYTSG